MYNNQPGSSRGQNYDRRGYGHGRGRGGGGRGPGRGGQSRGGQSRGGHRLIVSQRHTRETRQESLHRRLDEVESITDKHSVAQVFIREIKKELSKVPRHLTYKGNCPAVDTCIFYNTGKCPEQDGVVIHPEKKGSDRFRIHSCQLCRYLLNRLEEHKIVQCPIVTHLDALDACHFNQDMESNETSTSNNQDQASGSSSLTSQDQQSSTQTPKINQFDLAKALVLAAQASSSAQSPGFSLIDFGNAILNATNQAAASGSAAASESNSNAEANSNLESASGAESNLSESPASEAGEINQMEQGVSEQQNSPPD